ncbi:hypothetical protein CK203_047314 [Vitis vinifera]|uniref:Retrovirus-related Pol polyprotein from transposon RE1 n=1 Tax=Vitis vinifera TaxID=29760 RepID=A0A438HHQ3_VITVI|nr:hypothetical protein CK203_047314 [Vitis vinifera]
MAVPNLQATVFNLIFNNLASTTKCLAHTLLPKMVELSANIVMSRKLALLSFFIPTFLLGIGLTLSAQQPTLSTGCLCLFLVVFHLLKFYLSLKFFEPCALEPSPSTSSPTTTRVPPSPPCQFCADDFAVEPLQVSSSATESTSSSAAVSPVSASTTTLVPFAAEVLWLTHLFRDLRVTLTHRPLLLCDNKSALFLSSNPVSISAPSTSTLIIISYVSSLLLALFVFNISRLTYN